MQENQDHRFLLKMTVDEAFRGMREGEGGPFGALITRNGKVIGRGHNTVLASSDPTAHAEINAIRDACRSLGSHELKGAVIYSNFEPCPMCLAAIYWSGIRTLFYCNDRSDAERIGFMDKFLYRELSLDEDKREISTSQLPLPEMEMLMEEWMGMEGKQLY
jgi:tRNA(Arg) A34 adenosine deaminase TadA